MNYWVKATQETFTKEAVKDTNQLNQKNLALTGNRMF
jgi:hypothetical protein